MKLAELLFVITIGSNLAVGSTKAAALTRTQAVDALLSPASGVTIGFPSVAWSPFSDYGFGVDHEGLLPALTSAEPAFIGVPPWPDPPLTNNVPAYFFWIDDEPAGDFMHATRFVLVSAEALAPTIENGGIRVSPQGWWPVLRFSDGRNVELWSTSEERTSDAPTGPGNRDGAVAGDAPSRTVALMSPNGNSALPPRSKMAAPPSGSGTACGLLVRGAADAHMASNVAQFRTDLIDHFGVSSNRIVTAASGGVATCDDLVAAIAAVCGMEPPCSQIFVRITSHGGDGCLKLGNRCVYKTELCTKFNTLGAKGVPIHMLINACYSFSLVDTTNYWAFPEGSTILTSANSNRTSYGGGSFSDEGKDFAGSLFAYAFSKCLRDPAADKNHDGLVDDIEAFNWVLSRPSEAVCFPWKTKSEERMLYAANAPHPFEVFDPHPQKSVVKKDPSAIGLNVQNGTGETKSDFHMIFQGDVRGGNADARRADAGGAVKIGPTWGKSTTLYDATRNETMVCWDSDAVRAGDYIIFRYSVPKGGLRFLRAYWTPTGDPPDDKDKVPIKSASLDPLPEAGHVSVRQLARGMDLGGWGYPWSGQIGFATLSQPISLEDLHFGNPILLAAATNRLGNTFLQPNEPAEFELTLPSLAPAAAPYLVFISQGQSPLNLNRTLLFEVFPLPAADMVNSRLEANRIGNEIELRWSGSAVLQSTDSLTSTWQAVPGSPQGSYRVVAQGFARFFRLTP